MTNLLDANDHLISDFRIGNLFDPAIAKIPTVLRLVAFALVVKKDNGFPAAVFRPDGKSCRAAET